jgi:NAD(P)H-flavin reductase
LCAAQPGQVIGVRGPFGTSWDEAGAVGRDLLLVAGGIGLAPLRPALLSALAQPSRYRRIILLAGARSPAELVFAAEYGQWREIGAEVDITVDRADASWPGQVGVVTQLIGRARLDPYRTTALVCGPEVMMRITARSLMAAGLPAASVWISLERNMQCGIAECGHCQLGPLLLCRDGPVVNFQVAEPLLAVREL